MEEKVAMAAARKELADSSNENHITLNANKRCLS